MSDFHFGKMLGIEIQNGRGTEMQCSNANGVYSEFHVIKHELMHPNKEKSTRKQPMKIAYTHKV